ncbi:MAG TPA: sulfurtransferase [Vicinamibacterales bacterium]|nr:sulfurtransferase [Vicinamibacterales bacterium]
MRTLHSIVRLAVVAALAASAVPAFAQRDSLLVTPAWLAQHASDANLVLLQVGDQAAYDAGHIPGARFVTLQQITTTPAGTPPLSLEMSPADTLRTQLQAIGISNDSHVVAYMPKDSVQSATRLIFTMFYAGLDNVSLLDGGMGAWVKDGRPLTKDVPPAKTGTIGPITPKPLVVDADFVQSHLKSPGFIVVDARDAAFYDGTQIGGPTDHRVAGHIAGAHSLPFNQMVTGDFQLKSKDELEALFTRAGVKSGDTVVAYCHIGQQATTTLFAAKALGHPILLYDGSFEDWARRGLPVENPSKKDK